MPKSRPEIAPTVTSTSSPNSTFKSKSGVSRIGKAMAYSLAGLRAAVRHEAAFRQELMLAIPMLLLVPLVAPGRLQALLMGASVVAVLVAELLNSAVEALADATSTEHHPLLGRAKDLGSAAVMLTLIVTAVVWVGALWP